MTQLIEDRVLDAYVARFPHLATLAREARAPGLTSRQAAITFAQNACRLEAPPGASALDIWKLAAVANGNAS